MPAPAPNGNPVGDILDRLRSMQQQPHITVGDLLRSFGAASFVPALMVPALIVVSPLSGIFFLPTICGLTMALIAAQMLIGRAYPWLPGIILARGLSGDRIGRMVARLDGWGKWVDRRTRPRLMVFARWPLSLLAPLGCFVSGLSMPFLELVPFSSSILGAAIVCFSVSILSRDGVFLLAGLGLIAGAALIPVLFIYRF